MAFFALQACAQPHVRASRGPSEANVRFCVADIRPNGAQIGTIRCRGQQARQVRPALEPQRAGSDHVASRSDAEQALQLSGEYSPLPFRRQSRGARARACNLRNVDVQHGNVSSGVPTVRHDDHFSRNAFRASQEFDPILRELGTEICERDGAKRPAPHFSGDRGFARDARLGSGDAGRTLSACLERLDESNIEIGEVSAFRAAGSGPHVDRRVFAEPHSRTGETPACLLDACTSDQHRWRLLARSRQRFLE